MAKKPKVDPVVSGEAKKAKKQKMALAKQLKGMTIDSEKKAGIHNRKMSSSSSSEDEAMEVDQVGPSIASKGIKKANKGPPMSRATYVEMKKA